jgi:hypothetical protein
MNLAAPDPISNSYFPAVAAVELGFFAPDGLDLLLEPDTHWYMKLSRYCLRWLLGGLRQPRRRGHADDRHRFHRQQVRMFRDQRNRALAAEIDIGLVDQHRDVEIIVEELRQSPHATARRRSAR